MNLTTYIGTKIIQATPQHADGRPGYQVVYEDGYTSWSPADVFERAYRKTDAMTFGDALVMMKNGRRVRRRGDTSILYLREMSTFRVIDSLGRDMPAEIDDGDLLAEDWQVVE